MSEIGKKHCKDYCDYCSDQDSCELIAHKPGTDEAINKIQEIRGRNNVLWMDIMRLAMKYAPSETEEIIKQIAANDSLITEQVLSMVKESEDGR